MCSCGSVLSSFLGFLPSILTLLTWSQKLCRRNLSGTMKRGRSSVVLSKTLTLAVLWSLSDKLTGIAGLGIESLTGDSSLSPCPSTP